MKLQTLEGLDKAIGGRPKAPTSKRRHSFYLNAKESELLKVYVRDNDTTVSELVRGMLKPMLK
tara:strand:- start:119 stop:307 length:189 start_codon:yes stop_codon:yes gene_type:complete